MNLNCDDKNSANRMQRACSMLRCSLFSRCISLNASQNYGDFCPNPNNSHDFPPPPCDSFINLRQNPRTPFNPVAKCRFRANNLVLSDFLSIFANALWLKFCFEGSKCCFARHCGLIELYRDSTRFQAQSRQNLK